jgi:hypothetical protein
MEGHLEFTQAENDIRKKWLFWTIQLPGFVTACSLSIFIIAIFIMQSSSNIETFSLKNFIFLGVFLFMVIFFGGGYYLNYHCCYKKPGTILLAIQMIGYLFSLLIIVADVIDKLIENPTILVPGALFFAYEVTILYYSYKLRKINKGMQERRIVNSPVYLNAVSVFSTANSLEQLDALFAQLRIAHVSENSLMALGRAYDLQKKLVSQSQT